mgnify:CR=1 FL=1|jgi:YggT family protein
MSYLLQASVTLVQFMIGLYLLLALLRFLLQLVRADFYNPVSQALVTATNPPLRLLRKFLPGYGGIDWSSIVLLFSVQALEISLLTLILSGQMPSPFGLLVLCVAHLLQLTAYLYMFFIFITIIISWISPGAYNPLTVLIYQFIQPIMSRVQRRIPNTVGLDWSPMVVLLGIYLFLSLVVAPLMDFGNHLNR